jgi:hypothetical protein
MMAANPVIAATIIPARTSFAIPVTRPSSTAADDADAEHTDGCPAHVYPFSSKHTALQPSEETVLPSSHASEEVLIASPQTCVHLDLPHTKGGHDHPASTKLQSALHPSPLLVLPSSHCSRPASLESPQAVLQTLGFASVHVYPHFKEHKEGCPAHVYPFSSKHTALQPSEESVLSSSHASEEVLIPFPQTCVCVQLGPEKPSVHVVQIELPAYE